MKLLYICFDPFPYKGACTSLLKNLFAQKELCELGEIHILAIAENSKVPLYEVVDEIHIHRFVSISRMRVKDVLKQLIKNPDKTLSEICVRVKRSFPKFFPASNLFYNPVWVNESVDALEKILSTESFDIIIPMAGRYEAAVAAMLVCKKHNINLGLYQVDPCSTNQVISASTYEERLNFEKELYCFAKFVITTPIIYEEMKGIAFDEHQNKVQIMEFPNVVIRSMTNKRERNNRTVRCIFAGLMHPCCRDPKFTMKLFSRLTDQNIKFELIGVKHDELTQYFNIDIPSNVVCRGRMPLEETQREISDADILVNIGNKLTNQVPSKLFEYIASGKPIVNICVNKTCPSLPYMERYLYALNLFQTSENEEFARQVAELEKFIHENAGKSVPANQILSLFRECTPEYCAALMAKIIKNSL
jgi:hypothetical protein